jgi:hypothetical protein
MDWSYPGETLGADTVRTGIRIRKCSFIEANRTVRLGKSKSLVRWRE